VERSLAGWLQAGGFHRRGNDRLRYRIRHPFSRRITRCVPCLGGLAHVSSLFSHRRNTLVGTTPEPDPRAALLVLMLGAMWLGASEAGILEAQQFVVVTLVEATLWAVVGAALYRKLAAPFLYLYFLVPSGAYLVPALQSFTAHFAVTGLHLLGIPVFSNGAVIEIPVGSFAVAEACAGLRFLVAALAFGVFFAIITYRSWWRRAAFVILSVIVPILANGLRALGLIAAAQWIGSPAAALADHIIYGWIFFSVVLVMLVLLGQSFSDRSVHNGFALAAAPEFSRGHPQLWSAIGISAALCLFAASSAPIVAAALSAPLYVAIPVQPPRVARSWQESHSPLGWSPAVVRPARSFLQSFVRGHDHVDRFIAIYAGQRRSNHPVHLNDSDANRRIWSFDYSTQEYLRAGPRAIPVRESIWIRGEQKRLVWSYYVIGGRSAADIWTAKWDQFLADVTRSKCLSAYVAVSVQAEEATAAKKLAGDLLAASEDLNSYLCASTKIQAHQ
jgi:exosortase A